MEVSVEPIIVTSLAPQVKDGAIAKLLPRHGEHPICASVIIHGINSAIANGLRRILLSEMDNLALVMDPDEWKCNDEFVMVDLIMQRLTLIPLVQAQVKEGMRFVLDVANDTDAPMDVMSSKLLFVASGKDRNADVFPFYETINILTLQPHRSVRLVAIVTRGSGYDNAAFATAFTAVSIPLDERPQESMAYSEPLPYAKDARIIPSSSQSNPHVYMLRFETVGKGKPADILRRAISSFIERARALKGAHVIIGQEKQSGGSSVQNEDLEDLYTIKMHGETRTIGELFVRCCYAVHPRIDFAASDLDDLTDDLTIRVRSNGEDVAAIIGTTVDYAIAKLEALLANIP